MQQQDMDDELRWETFYEVSGFIDERTSEWETTFDVPDHTEELLVRIRIEGGSRLAFQWNDPIRSRGHFVPWYEEEYGKEFEIGIARDLATRGLVEGPIVSGKWRLHIWAIPLVDRTSFSLTVCRRKQRDPVALAWYPGDLHLHSNHSDGLLSPEELRRAAIEHGLKYMCLTDHNTFSAFADIDYDFGRKDQDFVVIRGMELTTYRGHANAIGLSSSMDWRVDGSSRTFQDAAADARKLEALFSVNHPFSAYPKADWQEWDIDWSLVAGFEVWNSMEEAAINEQALQRWDELLNEGLRIAAVGGSDFHRGTPDTHRLGYPTTYILAARLTEADLMKGLKEGRVIVSRGEPVEASVICEGRVYVVGDRIPLTESSVVELQTASQFMIEHEAHVVKNGKSEVTGKMQGGGSIRLRVPMEPGEWLRVEFRDERGGLLAVTNPFWFEQAKAGRTP